MSSELTHVILDFLSFWCFGGVDRHLVDGLMEFKSDEEKKTLLELANSHPELPPGYVRAFLLELDLSEATCQALADIPILSGALFDIYRVSSRRTLSAPFLRREGCSRFFRAST